MYEIGKEKGFLTQELICFLQDGLGMERVRA
jgi:hypothetical protein